MAPVAVVFDLDGVVIGSRDTYRQAYCEAVNGLAGPTGPGVRIDDVHRLKQDPAFNAPRDCVRELLRGAGLRSDPADVEHALARAREHYAGSAQFERIYGAPPAGCHPGPGLSAADRLLLPVDRPPLPVPIAVFTGRDGGEARWVTERFAMFAALEDRHLWHNGNGVDKPDPTSFLACLTALVPASSAGLVLYLGDLAADAELVERYRRVGEGPAVVFALVGDEGPAERADLQVSSVSDLLDRLWPAASPANSGADNSGR